MAVHLDSNAQARARLLTATGADRAPALRPAHRRLDATTMVIDEALARAVLA